MFAIAKKLLKGNEKATSSVANAQADCAPSQLPDIGIIDMSLSGWFKHETGELVEGFPITAEDVVLDVGCGSGGFTLFSGQHGAEIYVADIDAEKVALAVDRLKATQAKAVHPLVTNVNPLPLASDSITRVIAMEVIEHVDNPKQFLGELVRVGQSGALYLLTVPDALSEHAQQGVAPAALFERPNHINIFERAEFEKLATDAGLVIERTFHYGFYRTLWCFLFWACDQPDLAPPWHPLLQQWDKTWATLLGTPKGAQIKHALDQVFPKSQVIVARKP